MIAVTVQLRGRGNGVHDAEASNRLARNTAPAHGVTMTEDPEPLPHPESLPPLPGLLASLDEDDRLTLRELGVPLGCDPGDILLRQGQQPRHVLLVLEGKVLASCVANRQHDILLEVHGRGELVGEDSVFEHRPYRTTVKALDRAVVLRVPGPAFREFLAHRPAFTLAVVELLAARLRETTERLILRSTQNTRARLTHLLLHLADRFGTGDGAGQTDVDVYLTQEAMASWVGASRETVNKLLTELRSSGVVELRRDGLSVDVAALRATDER